MAARSAANSGPTGRGSVRRERSGGAWELPVVRPVRGLRGPEPASGGGLAPARVAAYGCARTAVRGPRFAGELAHPDHDARAHPRLAEPRMTLAARRPVDPVAASQ